jgi:hypothetical protein
MYLEHLHRADPNRPASNGCCGASDIVELATTLCEGIAASTGLISEEVETHLWGFHEEEGEALGHLQRGDLNRTCWPVRMGSFGWPRGHADLADGPFGSRTASNAWTHRKSHR